MQVHDPADLPEPAPALPRVGAARILTGLLQGLLLYLLYRAGTGHAWPATHVQLFFPLVLVATFVPTLVVSGLGHLDRRRLALWAAGAALVLAGLGWYDAWRGADLPPMPAGPGPHALPAEAYQALAPSKPLLFFAAAGLFIAHTLVLAAVRDRRRIASYPTYFDGAWQLGVQLAFSALFTGVTWLVLLLGAQLFELVKLRFLTELMQKAWFNIPVTAFAFACAMHLTDVRPAIVRGIRGLLLVLLSWLLPVAVLLVGGFLATLPFTGLAALWSTKHAASVLLCAAAAFVILVNAAWQQGSDAQAVARPVRIAARLAALLLAPLVLIAIHALYLRVRDYGWTADRIDAAACMLVAACYAAGYFRAGLQPGWLPALARVNIGTAFVVLAVLLALFSPLLDPARISVDSQVARLEAGRIKPDAFDLAFLRFDGERFGRAALDRLDHQPPGPDAAALRRRIAAVQAMKGRWDRGDMPAAPFDLAANLRVHPAGARLPDGFLHTDWGLRGRGYPYPDCLRRAGAVCDAFLLDVTGDGQPEVLLFRTGEAVAVVSPGSVTLGGGAESVVLGADAQGKWSALATVALPAGDCAAVRADIAAGKVGTAPAVLSDLEIGGRHARLQPYDLNGGCRRQAR